jgi:membrane-bound lytic murein transglycosylase B
MGAGDPAPGLTLSPDTATEAGRQRVLMETVDLSLRDRLAGAEAEIRAAALQVDEARGSLQRIVETIDLTTRRRDAAIAELSAAEPALPLTQSRYHDQFMTARVRGADFTVVALHAYRSAALVVNAELPACRVTWSILAGIGRVESRHGTYAGSTVRADGSTSRRIIGIALDGSPGVMLIPDTDGGALDGDAVYDRAVGPMQFIPSTWRMVRRDGNGDGRMDPHNLYDAAAAAGAYLCRNGLRLDRPSELNRAILSYNRSQPYVEQVLGHRRAYERLRLPE